uniref:Uncharacterized protein n=1 Tax=Candidatus Kentrum sp. LFY TaxID=2126342 RepID=A0A450UNE9_9GAMM|nr:MAG: hypothetical protein BECKLFY1418B_GA0070995_105311 [Candidatus Kentron sp. LFY]
MNMQLTLNVSEELAARLVPLQDRLPDILTLGLRELNAENSIGFRGIADVLEFLADMPGPEEVLALRPDPTLRKTIDHLLEKNWTQGLDVEEERQWRQYEYLEHLVRKAKISAKRQLSIS